MTAEAVQKAAADADVHLLRAVRSWNCFPAVIMVLLLGGGQFCALHAASRVATTPADAPRSPPGTLTFNRHIAPLVFQKCAGCHRPGETAPFDLLTYADFRKRAETIKKVVANKYMPPWLPEPGFGEFQGDRSLTPAERGLLLQWLEEGAAEGKASDLPPLPQWAIEWDLGKPDLIVALAPPYTLAAEGKDLYRNFVLPLDVPAKKYVRAVQFRPGNNKVVHHAFVEIDATRQSRYLAKGAPPGFDGMQLPESVEMPGGQMLGWQPGKRVQPTADGLSWALMPGSDLVLQLHLHPSGKQEVVGPSVGFYFTDQAPTNTAYRINLNRYAIDIPAGTNEYWIEQEYVLPVDLQLLAISPHAHYLGKELQGFALLPDGTKRWLLLIKQWDFNWQGVYQYRTPLFLPKGTKLCQRFSYDNSTNNIHNPFHPPQRIKFGLATTNEMGELWFQVLPLTPVARQVLARDFSLKLARDAVLENGALVKADPQDAAAEVRLGSALISTGQMEDAVAHLTAATRLAPDNDQAFYQLGSIYLRQARYREAQAAYQQVVRLNPADFQSHGSLGFIALHLGSISQAELHFQEALRINPNDPIARSYLEQIRRARAAQP